MRYRSGSVYRRSESRQWWISYYINGKQIRESAKTTNRKEADRLLVERIANGKEPQRRSIGESERVNVFETSRSIIY